MAQKLTGKSAVVTGSGDGIGKAIALAMAAEGAKVVVNDIGKSPDGSRAADKVVEEIKKAGGTAAANYDSVATMEGGVNIIKTATSNFGRIDILVNCAGNYLKGGIADIKEADWDSVMDVHVKGHLSCGQAAVKEMIPQKSGSIINIGSNAGFDFKPGGLCIAYAAAKASVLGMTATMSANLKEHGIRVNCILPGAITKLFPWATRTGFGSKKREGPEYVAPVIIYLGSDESKNVTGRYIYAAGGDLILYTPPFQMPGPHMYVRKAGKWSVDEIAEVLPTMLG